MANPAKDKTDNSDLPAKVVLRKWLLNEMGGPANTRVLELCAGMGNIHDACYQSPPVKKHMAFEIRPVPNRPTWLQGDNRMLLKSRAKGWDLYDVDAFANPWILANDICKLREPGVFAMTLTDGLYRNLQTGDANGFVRQRTNLMGTAMYQGMLVRFYMDIVKLLMDDWRRHGVTVKKAKFIDSSASRNMRYFGVICEKAQPKVSAAHAPQLLKPKKVSTV